MYLYMAGSMADMLTDVRFVRSLRTPLRGQIATSATGALHKCFHLDPREVETEHTTFKGYEERTMNLSTLSYFTQFGEGVFFPWRKELRRNR